MSVSSHFERSPSAARQLQIIALSSGRQPQSGTYTHTVQSAPPTVEPPELSSQSKRTLSGEDVLPLPLNSTLPKNTSPLPSPPSLLSPASPPSQPGPQTQTLTQKEEVKESEEQRERGQGVRDEGSVGKDLKVEKDDQREKVKEEKRRLSTEKEGSLISQKEQEVETGKEEEQMEVTEEGQSDRERAERGEEKKMEEEEEGETAMDQSENLTSQILHQYQNTDPIPTPDAVKDSGVESKPILGLISAPVADQTPASVPVTAPVPAPVPEVSAQSQRLPEPHRDLQPVSQEDFCENMSTQSDNQSGTCNHTSVDPTQVLPT